jgi:hypothetical protein
MATRSSIAIEKKDGKFLGIYCHWDGYIENNGSILFQYYDTYEKALKLIEKGDLSSLNNSCKKPKNHSFDNPVEGYCIYYHRDKGEDWEDVKPCETDTYEEMISKIGQGYDYIFKNGEWFTDQGNLKDLLLNSDVYIEVKEFIKKKITKSRKNKLNRVKNED